MKRTGKAIIVVASLVIAIAMSSLGVYAICNSQVQANPTIKFIENELKDYLNEYRPEIEVGSEAYIEYLCDLLTFENDSVIAENEYYEDIKIYASEYLSDLNNPEATKMRNHGGDVIIELDNDVKEKTIRDIVKEAKAEDIRASQISAPLSNNEYSTLATYSDSAAVAYAKKYGESRNIQYNKHYGKDCTNFVSQCVKAGGKSMTKPNSVPTGVKETTSYWYSVRYYDGNNEMHYKWKESSSFVRVTDFYTYWKNKGIKTMFYSTKAKLQKGVALGDVVQLRNGDGKWYHSIIITGGTMGARKYSAHSRDYVDKDVSEISGKVSYRVLKF